MTRPENAQPFAEPLVDWFFQDDDAARLGPPAGLSAETARRAIAQGVPLLLRDLVDYARTTLGQHQIAEAVSIIPHFPSVAAALTTGYGAQDLERAGQSMAPTLLREHHETIAAHVAAETHADLAKIRRLFDMALPLILSRLNWRDAWALGILPLLGTLPAAQAVSGLARLPNAAVPLHTRTVTTTVVQEEERRRRGGFPWWLLPLLLLLLLGGCWLLKPREVYPAPSATGGVNSTATSHQFAITSPAGGAAVTANGFRASGTGQPGQVVTVYRDGQQVGTFAVDKNGQWVTDVLDPQATGNVAYEFRDPDGKVLGTLPLSAAGAVASVAPVNVTSPQPGDQVAAGGFSIAGTGKPDANYQVYEDGVSIGTFKVGPDGTWSVDVPGPTPGDHNYTVLDDRGNRVALLPLKVASAEAAAACTGAPTISLAENETVTAPFRFGGRGSAKTYTVSVWRGDRQVGQRDVKLSADCSWSYSSDPGGKAGQQASIRYEVRPAGTATSTSPGVKATLTVSGSGTNFNSKGEYVGPTK